MTISSQNRKAGPFIGTGLTTVFPFTFKVFTTADVYVVRSALGAETVLTLVSDYTVTLNADQNASPGGNVTLPVALPVGSTLTITSALAYIQPTDLTNLGGFYPTVINSALDRLTIFVQQLAEKLGRALALPISTPTGVSATLPLPTPNGILAWNGSATAFTNLDPLTLGGSGAGSISYSDGGAGAITRPIQARVREEAASVVDYGADPSGAADSTAAIQLAINTGRSVYFPPGSYRMSTVDVSTLGQMIVGSGRGRTDIIMMSGGKGFRFRARNTGICALRFVPPGNVAGVQSTLVADCVTIQNTSDDDYLEGFHYEDISCENIRGAAINMISPLRESLIENFRWHGMGNVATSVGAFNCVNPSNTKRSPNNITIREGSVYRFGVPWLNLTVQDLGLGTRDQPPYAQIRVENVLSHGQLLNENTVPSPLSVMPEPCHHIYAKGVEGFYVSGTRMVFSAVHPNFNAVRVDAYTPWAVNKAVAITDCYATYGLTVPAIPANTTGVVVGGATGGYFRVTDCIDLKMHDCNVAGGYFQYDFDHRDSGSHSSTLVSSFTGNQSINQFQPVYNAPDWFNVLDPGRLALCQTIPRLRLQVPGSSAVMDLTADGAGSLRLDLDPAAVVSATRLDIAIDNQVLFSIDKDGVVANVRYLQLVPTSEGSAPINCVFLPNNGASAGKLAFKAANGTVNATY